MYVSYFSKMTWLTNSKALVKSRNKVPTIAFLSTAEIQSSRAFIRAV